MDQDERHYKSSKLNLLFTLSSILLLVALGWLLMDDYVRQWKQHQSEFQSLEIEKTRMKYEEATQELEGQEAYQALLQKLDKAQQEYEIHCTGFDDIEKKVEKLKTQQDLREQEYKFAKAERDALRYRYEEAQLHNPEHLHAAETEFLESEVRLNELKIQFEESQQALKEEQAIIQQCSERLEDLERQERQMAAQRDLVERKLKIIDPDTMSLPNRIANKVRDLPMIDLANPKVKIQQIVLRDIRDNVNFMQVPKVDRCTTCHLGITNPEYKDAPQPYTTHPNLELFLAKKSPHPIEEFGCTVCHGGRGRGTNFSSAVHTPSSPEQQIEWEKKYHWKKMELWDEPMLPLKYTESGCFKCHSGRVTIPGAEKLNQGIHLVEKAGCFNCHLIKQYEDWPKSGPSLRKLDAKLTQAWAYKWIRNPRSFRHNTWMPSFYGQSNNSDATSEKRNAQEIHAIVHYLFDVSEPYEVPPLPVTGNPERGKELVSSVGCLGCHEIQKTPFGPESPRNLFRQHGPNLIGLGSKTTSEWLFRWLKDPKTYHAASRMPNLRLSDQEAADIALYLTQDRNGSFDQKEIPVLDEQVIDEILFGFLTKMDTHKEAQHKIASMDLDQKLSYTGERLINHYGCYACHDIKGFEHANPVGTELTEEGSKSVHKLDFGLLHLDHNNFTWFDQKLRNPRMFDQGKVRPPDEKLKMPNFYFSDEEVDALVTFLLGLVDTAPVEHKMVSRSPENLHLEAGQKEVRLYNCQGCHLIEGIGGAIQPTIEGWLMAYDNRTEAEAKAIAKSFSPPNLVGEGKKVHAEWLFDFLHEPSTIRPWLKVRMPTFRLSTDELNTLVTYFNELDNQPFPFAERVDTGLTEEEYHAAERLFSKDYLDCASCHIVGNQFPAGSPDRWAPNFALAKERLKPNWIIEWLMNPADVLPGTKMPTYFDPNYFEDSGPPDILEGDEHEQIRVLRNYLLTLSEGATHQNNAESDSPSHTAPSTP